MAAVNMLEKAAQSSYQRAAEKVRAGTQRVSKVAVMNKIHKLVEELPEEEEEKKRIRYLYVEADEDHIHRQKAGKEIKGNYIIGKLIYVHEGRREVCKGRRELEGRREMPDLSFKQLGMERASIPRQEYPGLQCRRTCNPCIQRTNEFKADGLERDRSRPDVPIELSYAERIHAELMSTLTRKQIGICLNRKLF